MTAHPRHILILTDRDWTHPEGGGTGTVLYGQVSRWLAWGHRVTVIARGGGGADRVSHPELGLELHRMGSRRTVRPRAAWATMRGLGRDADAVLEVCEGVAFFTGLWRWLRAPRVLLVRPRSGRTDPAPRTAALGVVLERAQLLLFYPLVPMLAPTAADRDRLVAMGVHGDLVEAVAPGGHDATAARTLELLRDAEPGERVGPFAALARTEAGKAGGLAAATLANNAIQLVFTIIFTRLLGKAGYGTLAALVSAFLILLVAGQSAQLAAAREAALDRLGHAAHLRATLRAWTQRLLVAAVLVGIASIFLRGPLATVIGVPEEPWGAAAIPVTGVLWMLLSLQRGALQGLRAYGTVGWSIVAEGAGRLVCSLLLVLAGLGVTGALLGLPLAFLLVSIWLERELHRHVGPVARPDRPLRSLRSLVGDGWVPILGLFLLASLQNVDVIVAKHELGSDAAGSYAAAAVAAKAVVWIAIGIGLHLLPEATRRAAEGLDPRPVLLRALAILGVIAAPALLIFAAIPKLLLRLAFGPAFVQASGALVLLGFSMTLLAVAYLTVQYMVALGEKRFVWVLGVIAIAEPFLLTAAHEGISTFAAVVLAVQATTAVSILVMGLTSRHRRRMAVA